MLVNHPLAEAVKPSENSPNKGIEQAIIEDVRAGEERGRGHEAPGEVV